MASNLEAENNHGKVLANVSNKASPRKKESCCKFCNKKFTNYQALGGHQNAHKDERAAAQKEKILSMASAYNRNSFIDGFSNSNQVYGFGGKTLLGVSSLSMTNFKPHYDLPYIGLNHNNQYHVPWSRYHTLNRVQPTIHQLQTLMDEVSGFHQYHKSYQLLTFPISRGGALNSESQLQLLCTPSLCDKENFDQASNSSIKLHNAIIERLDLNLNLKISCDGDNSGEAKNLSAIPTNPGDEELDLTLSI